MAYSNVADRQPPPGAAGGTGSAATTVHTSSGVVDTSRIIGWGVDANPQNDPTYPYRDRSADDRSGQWQRPSQQKPEVELLMSVEHKQLPAVFGTTIPPRWASGAVRRIAFRWTESNWMHWLLLIGADRIDMVEGLLEDLARLNLPNIPKEIGLRAAWRHNKKGIAVTVGVSALVLGGLVALSRRSEPGPRSSKES
jgi:hypothetical protein